MEEMQKAFNKTIIKLQNTSRIAEEQVSKTNTGPDSLHRLVGELMADIAVASGCCLICFQKLSALRFKLH